MGFKFRQYRVSEDPYQFILTEGAKKTFHRSLEDTLEEIYEREQKTSLRGSESLTEAIKSLKDMHKSFITEIQSCLHKTN